MGNLCGHNGGGGGARRGRSGGSAYEMVEHDTVAAAAARTKLTRLDRDRVYRPELRCRRCALNIADSLDGDYENTLSRPDLEETLSRCKSYHHWLREHRGDIQPRDSFYTFVQSGRLWILHSVHAAKCEDAEVLDAALEGLQDWYSALLTTYEANIYNPHAVSRTHDAPTTTGATILILKHRPQKMRALPQRPSSDGANERSIRDEELRLEQLKLEMLAQTSSRLRETEVL